MFVVARFRPMNSREKEISTKSVDEKGFKIQFAANPPTALDYPVMTHGRCRYGDTDVAITGGTAHGEQKFALDKYLLTCDPLRRCRECRWTDATWQGLRPGLHAEGHL